MLCLTVCLLSSAGAQKPSPDSNYIRRFAERNIIETQAGIYGTQFRFSGAGTRGPSLRLSVNSNSSAGINVSYKWLSLKYATAIPGTKLDRNTKTKYTGFGFSFGNRKWRYYPFYDRYNGLLIPGGRRTFEPVKDIRVTDWGVDVYRFTNIRKYSFQAAHSFSVQQLKSAGAVFFALTPLWQKIDWLQPSSTFVNDSTTYKLLAANPGWFSITVKVGYTYNFSFDKGRWIVAPAFAIGGGALREKGVNKKVHPAGALQTWISGGYNGKKYYCYLYGIFDNQQSHFIQRKMNKEYVRISLTGGFRFANFKKKILGLL